ncbi:MAG: methylmalonyl-CoA mutase family protein [Bacteroidetes bacterium]|nr:methylmalonyl-CoA mutase family protein [Bacteroidota bacterium]
MGETSEARRRWEETTLKRTLDRSAERRTSFETSSGIPVERLYMPEDIAGTDYLTDIGFPGEYPFTRGVQPTMYRGRLWTMRQYAGFATAEESNRRYRYLLDQGQTGLSIAFDLPTQMGYDSDHPLALGEVGRVGVAISSLDDMETMFSGIPLDRVSTSMTINATAAILLAMYIAVARRQGVPLNKLSGTVQNDILKEYVARGTYIFPPRPSLRLAGDIIEYCAHHLPNWNSISVSGYHMREAGATAVQELAFTIADAKTYVRTVLERGIGFDAFAPRLSFFFATFTDFLEEIAKYRAARRLWARIAREEFGARSPQSRMLRFHTQTGGSTLTAQQPLNNIVRVTVQALAAILGGAQSLHTCSWDEALALPSEEAVRLSLRTQQILAHETGVTSTVDPLGGSYCVEALTDEIERRAREYLDRIEQAGGTLWALESGYFRREIEEAAYRYQKEVEARERIVVGVNQFTTPEPPAQGLMRVDPRVAEEQLARLAALRQRREGQVVQETLDRLRQAAQGSENLMPFLLDCVEALCTVGEICDVLRAVFGEHRETSL